MYSSARNCVLGIADPKWPECSVIEKIALGLGIDTIVSTDTAGFLSKQSSLGMIVMRIESNDSLQTAIELIKGFGESIEFIVRVDSNDVQTVATLARIPHVHVVGNSDFSESTWVPLLNQLHLHLQEKLDKTASAASKTTRSYVFVDPRSQHLLTLVERLAVTKAPVLLQGATGSGKEVLARTLHELSDRANKPFVALNCAAMPEHLVEDMLFGHEKGAFTGASRELAGVFEQANGGTVFLDEIGEMPIQLQAKLLRVLQEKEVVRLGGRDVISLNFRLVAATNKDLKAGISEKSFREDLYYRISAFKLQVPGLAERPGDIVPLANALALKHGCNNAHFSEGALRHLYAYHWPGNVRELDNVIQRAVVFADYGRIEADHIFFDEPMIRQESSLSDSLISSAFGAPNRGENSAEHAVMESPPRDLQSAVRASEYDVIMEAIHSTRTREEAARKLGISPRTLRYKMAKLRESGNGLSHCA